MTTILLSACVLALAPVMQEAAPTPPAPKEGAAAAVAPPSEADRKAASEALGRIVEAYRDAKGVMVEMEVVVGAASARGSGAAPAVTAKATFASGRRAHLSFRDWQLRLANGRIVQAFSALEDEIDYLIVDMAAGISPSVLAFMAACQRRYIVVRDDPSSIADAYGTIKVLIQDYDLNEIYIIPNAVASQAEGQNLFRRINQVCAQFLNYTTHYLGAIEYDDQILAAHRKYEPVMEFAPGSNSARDFKRLAKSIAQMPPTGTVSGGMQFFVERLVRFQA